jgi:hypothetical protein
MISTFGENISRPGSSREGPTAIENGLAPAIG